MLALSPNGHLHVTSAEQHSSVADAFARGSGYGLLHLGLVEIGAALPPDLAFFRELARRYLTAACSAHDLEERRERIEIAPPRDELEQLANAAPPMPGAEYVNRETLELLWRETEAAFRDELRAWRGTVAAYLGEKSSVWNLVGRVCFHLAENKRDPERPFAFLATYSTRVSAGAKVQHAPLGQAVRQSGAAANKNALLSLLIPVERTAKRSALVRELVDSGELFEPLAWTPREAHHFLKEVPALEAAGVVVRVPDWWKKRARPQVSVRIGATAPSKLGLDALLDFSVGLSLDGEELSEAEWRAIRVSTDGLALVRGRWIEVDRERIEEVLAHWKRAQRAARDGLNFIEGMRLLAGADLPGDGAPSDATREWSRVAAGDWLAETLRRLREPAPFSDGGLKAELRPYQQTGAGWLRHLSALGLGACLADDMGLGKTIQEGRGRRARSVRRVLRRLLVWAARLPLELLAAHLGLYARAQRHGPLRA